MGLGNAEVVEDRELLSEHFGSASEKLDPNQNPQESQNVHQEAAATQRLMPESIRQILEDKAERYVKDQFDGGDLTFARIKFSVIARQMEIPEGKPDRSRVRLNSAILARVLKEGGPLIRVDHSQGCGSGPGLQVTQPQTQVPSYHHGTGTSFTLPPERQIPTAYASTCSTLFSTSSCRRAGWPKTRRR